MHTHVIIRYGNQPDKVNKDNKMSNLTGTFEERKSLNKKIVEMKASILSSGRINADKIANGAADYIVEMALNKKYGQSIADLIMKCDAIQAKY